MPNNFNIELSDNTRVAPHNQRIRIEYADK